jgi:hypothetical protein
MSWPARRTRPEVEPLDLNELPTSFFQTAGEILEEDRGLSKLRNRNDKIHSELEDLATKHKGSKLSTYKVDDGDYVCYHLRGLDISVKLVNR